MFFQGKSPDDDVRLSALNLKPKTKIMMMGTREENLVWPCFLFSVKHNFVGDGIYDVLVVCVANVPVGMKDFLFLVMFWVECQESACQDWLCCFIEPGT